jgi:S1-C subfamily serine protease
MNRRIWKVVGLLAAVLVVFGVGAAAGGGVVFAATRAFNPAEDMLTTVAYQAAPQEEGILIASVVPDGPADQAGVKRGDILLKIDSQVVNQPSELQSYLNGLKSGDQVTLNVRHGDEERTLTSTLGEQNGRPYLGVVLCGSGQPVMRTLPAAAPGALITQVVSGSPAEQAGLQAGDVITAVDGQQLSGDNSLANLIGEHKPGDSVTLDVNGPDQQSRQVTVKLGEKPDQPGSAYLGVQYVTSPQRGNFEGQLPPFQGGPFPAHPFRGGRSFRLPNGVEQGAVVHRVAENSPAQTAGLQPGDVITAVNDQTIDGPDALSAAVGQHKVGDTLSLTVARAGSQEPLKIDVTLAENPNAAGQAYLGVVTTGVSPMKRQPGNQDILPGWDNMKRQLKFELPFGLKVNPLSA